MSPEVWRDRILMMIEDIDRIGAFVGQMERDAFVGDVKTVFAVSYAFVRLGEAVGHIPEEVVQSNPDVEWGEIRRFRNFMVHVYDQVDPGRLYDTVKQDLPRVLTGLRRVVE